MGATLNWKRIMQHQRVSFWFEKSIPKMAARRLQHYAIFLSEFNYKVKYIKTTENSADFLSSFACY